MATQVPRGGLLPVEESLVEHVCRGDWLDLIPEIPKGKVIDEGTMRSWDDSQTCRATVIRDILRGRLATDPDPHGLRLRGSRITGRLDLENLGADINFELRDCLLEEGMLVRNARLASISLAGCHLEHSSESPLDADLLTCSSLDLRGARIIGHANAGAVRLAGAQIGGLEGDGASLRNDSGSAVHANGLQVDQDMFLRGSTIVGAGEDGAVRLVGAHIGNLEADRASLRNDSGPALSADGLQVDQNALLHDGFIATGAGDDGAVRMPGAHIGIHLSFIRAKLRNDSGPALHTAALRVDQIADLRESTIVGAGEDGAVRLVGAHIRSLEADRASLRNDSGPALHADGLQVDQAAVLRYGFTATGAGKDGAVRLLGAHIGSQLSFSGANLHNDSGPALCADGVQVDQAMFLRNSTIVGAGDDGAVRLPGAHIRSHLYFSGASLRNDFGPALYADALQVGQAMFLDGGFAAVGGGDGVVVDLKNARVGGTLVFGPIVSLKHVTDSQGRLAVDGLTYASVPEQVSAQDWLRLLRDGTRDYAAQPYQQLAAGHRALGHERQARQILMAQRDDQLARTDPRWSERLWGKITKVILGYGYQPWRALLFLAGVAVLSCVLAVVLGSHGALAQTDKTAAQGQPCTVIQQVSVGLDLNLPIGTSVARAKCDLVKNSASATAAWLTAVGWVLRVLAWAFAALFIAGFTSAVRKT